MLNDIVKEYIDKSVLCWLATCCQQHPSVSPKEIFTYYGNDTILIAHITSSNSIKNIRHNPNVCVSFIDIFIQKGFQCYGTAEILTDESDMYEKKKQILQKMAGEAFLVKSVISVKIIRIKPIIAPSYHFYQDICEEDMVQNALKTYGVK